jgi:hypothetical protein
MAIQRFTNSRIGPSTRFRGFRFSLLYEPPQDIGVLTNTVACGNNHIVAIKTDGTVVAAGCDTYGQVSGVQGWTNMKTIHASGLINVGLTNDGQLMYAGGEDYYTDMSPLSDWPELIDVMASRSHIFGMDAEGNVYVHQWGTSPGTIIDASACDMSGCSACLTGGCFHGRCCAASNTHIAWIQDGHVYGCNGPDNGYPSCTLRADYDSWENIVKIALTRRFTLGMDGNGDVVATGDPEDEPVSQVTADNGWTNLADIAAANMISIGLRKDGTVLMAAYQFSGDVSGWTDIASITGTEGNNDPAVVGLRSDGTILTAGKNGQDAGFNGGASVIAGWTDVKVPEVLGV